VSLLLLHLASEEDDGDEAGDHCVSRDPAEVVGDGGEAGSVNNDGYDQSQNAINYE
jgi:hypothetical protein